MALTAGERLGPYEILALIGEGGMGQVWRARDTRLNRTVAIKTSLKKFNERFEREAHTVASLNHPNICCLYDVGPDYLVMEYVEGAPLKGPLPVDEALKYAGQILDALDAAHRKGITHRDLKPGNILLTKGGIKLLDFGLAKTSHGPSQSEETLTAPLTGDGAMLGTLQYMAPEQLEGKEADARSDIFAFGLVLYEMIAGKRAFSGATHASLIASILKEQAPSLSGIQPLMPKALDRVVQTCLEKDPDKRWQSAREVKHALDWIKDESTVAAAPIAVAAASKAKLRVWQGIAAALTLAAIGVAAWGLWPKPAKVTRFQVDLPQNVSFAQYLSVSPDGRKILFNATGEQGGLWIRDLETLEWRHLPDTQGAVSPFWSPDSRFVGFGILNQLKKMDIAGGPPQTLCQVAAPVGTGSWSKDGVIIFGGRGGGALHRVSEAGGVATDVTVLDTARGDSFHALPAFLPDDKHFLYLRQGSEQTRGIYVGSLDAKPAEQSTERLLATQFAAAYADGYLFFMRENTLMAQPFDPGKLKLKGDPLPVVEKVATTQSIGVFSISPMGVLAYRSGRLDLNNQLTWFDREGKANGTPGQPGPYEGLVLSPDGIRTAGRDATTLANGDIWVTDLIRGIRTRLTFRQGNGSGPVWSPDGNRIAFSAGIVLDTIFEKNSSGAGDERELYKKAGEEKYPTSWSSDGRFLLYYTTNTLTTGDDLWVLPLQGASKPALLLGTPFNEGQAVFSPDMRWIAYTSTESGRPEIYVRPFFASGPSGVPALGEGKWQISRDGGKVPRWVKGGSEIIYQVPPNGTVKMAVQVKTNGTALEASTPERLFQAPIDYGWDVTADGKRFLLAIAPNSPEVSTPITVLLNWQATLKK